MNILITRPIPSIGLTMLKKKYHVVVHGKSSPMSRAHLLARVRGAHAILSFLNDHIDEEVLERAGTQLKIVSNFAVGYDNIDLSATSKRGIVVTNAPCQEVSDAVAEHTIALMLGLLRRVVDADVFMRSGKFKGWDPDLFIGAHPYHRTLGLIGLGRIGKRVAHYATGGFSMRVLYNDVLRDRQFEKQYAARYATIHRLLATSDVVSIHVPLTRSTRHLISRPHLARMKRGAFLINTSRGPVVDTHAVVNALEKGQLGGFAADVFECEPKLACSIADDRFLRACPRAILTPHIASATKEARDAMAVRSAENIVDVLSGRPCAYAVSFVPSRGK